METRTGIRLQTEQSKSILERRYIYLALAALFVNSILRGIRAPSLYPATQLLLNYDFGFSKRGLLGELIARAHVIWFYHYSFFVGLSAAIFATNMFCLAWISLKIVRDRARFQLGHVFVFASSLALVQFAHFIGYFEEVTLLITIGIIQVKRFYARLLVIITAFAVSLMVHETGFVLFFPLIVLRCLPDVIGNRRLSAKSAALLCVIAATTLVLLIVSRGTVNQTAAVALYHDLQSKADYSLFKDAFWILRLSFYDNLKLVWHTVWPEPEFQAEFVLSALANGPSTAYFVAHIIGTLRERGYTWRMGVLATLAGVAPAFMCLVGTDFSRFCALTTITSFLVLFVVATEFPMSPERSTVQAKHGLRVPLLLVALNLGSSAPLYDGYVVQDFPYPRLLEYTTGVLMGREEFPPRPIGWLPPSCSEMAEMLEIVGPDLVDCRP